jgi:hypothetical protein
VRRLLALGGVLAGLALAGPAGAATYPVQTCTNGSLAGWSHFNFGDWSSWSNGCGVPGAGLAAAIETAPGSSAGWRFSAPPDTDIAAFRVTRSFSLAANRPYGTSVYVLATAGSGRDYVNWYANYGGSLSSPPSAEAASGLTGQTTLTAKVDCGGGAACTGPSGLVVYDAWLDLRDDAAPAITAASGTLLASGAQKGTRALSFSATDRGGGLARAQLLVDGLPAVDGPVDAGAASCSGPPFAAAVPCPLSASATLRLDTTRLAEGRHEAELLVSDATGVNRTRYGPFAFVVDNVPPPAAVSPPRVTGTARQGGTLVAEDGTWSGAALTMTRAWQRQERGGWEDIAGATGVTYVATSEDVGHRLRVRVRAGNADGTGEAVSEPTAAVAAAPAGPSPTATPAPAGPSPTATPAPPESPRPAAPGAPAADQRAVVRVAFETEGRTAATLPWGQTRRVVGSVLGSDGQPLAGVRVEVASLLRVRAAVPVPLRAATTDGGGRFSYVLPAGVSRTVTFAYRAAHATITVRVIAHVVMRARRARGVVHLSGRVPGAPDGLRKRVELQVRRGDAWRPFATTRLTLTGGRFTYRARASASRWRAVIRGEPGWPFVTASSTTVKA